MSFRENLKEKWQNLDKSKAAVVTVLVLTFGLTLFNTYQIQQLNLPGKVSAQAGKKPSDYKFGTKYEKALEAKKPIALLFYADWCHFCVGFMPKYEKLYKQFKRKYNFVKINVEDPKYRDAVVKYNITGFPTLFLVNPQTDDSVRVDNADFNSDEFMKGHFNTFYKERFLENDKKDKK